ncbi:NAD-dependent epimerase/dehydratase family protein [Sessilibacter sp. MAH4]
MNPNRQANVIAITGASGLIGGVLVTQLKNTGHEAVELSRNNCTLDNFNSFTEAVKNVDVFVHLAAVTHNPNATYQDYYEGNVEFTEKICTWVTEAKNKNLADIKRVLLISSIKVMGESTLPDQPFVHTSTCNPEDNYGKTKLLAEQKLKSICNEAGTEWCIIRPPLVYTPNAKGNLQLISKVIDWHLPLPLGNIQNRRDLVDIKNLVELISICSTHPAASSQIFLVSDGKPLSTSELVKKIATDTNRKVRLIRIPKFMQAWIKSYSHKSSLIQRLFGNLEVDITHTSKTLNWHPNTKPNDL